MLIKYARKWKLTCHALPSKSAKFTVTRCESRKLFHLLSISYPV